MMKLNRNSRFVRYCYSWEWGRPIYTSVCELFWLMVKATIIWICAIAGLLVLSPVLLPIFLGSLIFKHLPQRAQTWLCSPIEDAIPAPLRLTGAWLKTKKSRICPTIELVEDAKP